MEAQQTGRPIKYRFKRCTIKYHTINSLQLSLYDILKYFKIEYFMVRFVALLVQLVKA